MECVSEWGGEEGDESGGSVGGGERETGKGVRVSKSV